MQSSDLPYEQGVIDFVDLRMRLWNVTPTLFEI